MIELDVRNEYYYGARHDISKSTVDCDRSHHQKHRDSLSLRLFEIAVNKSLMR